MRQQPENGGQKAGAPEDTRPGCQSWETENGSWNVSFSNLELPSYHSLLREHGEARSSIQTSPWLIGLLNNIRDKTMVHGFRIFPPILYLNSSSTVFAMTFSITGLD